jgi:hypothetical protein
MIKRYEIESGRADVHKILQEINEDIKKISSQPVVSYVLTSFQKKHDIKKSEIGAKLLELNNNISLLGYTIVSENFRKTISNWYNKPQSIFIEQGKRDKWTGKEKLISLMLYTQMYNETEAEELLLKFGFENLYIFDYFEACAKITWRLGGNYESFLALLEREKELLPEDNRVEYGKTIYTPQALEEFNNIKQIEEENDPDVSFVSFVQIYREDFGRTHKSSFKWLCDMISQVPETENSYSIINKMIAERKSLISNKSRRAQIIGKKYMRKYSCDPINMSLRDNYKYVVEHFLESEHISTFSTEKYDEIKNKLFSGVNRAQYDMVDQIIGEILIDNYFLADMLEYEATKNVILDRPWMEISQEECDHMLSNEASVSRIFLLSNVLTNMSFRYIENNYIKPLEGEEDILDKLPDIIIDSLNKALLSFGFGILKEENGGIDYLLLTAIYNMNYGETFPFRVFSIGNWEFLCDINERMYENEAMNINQGM